MKSRQKENEQKSMQYQHIGDIAKKLNASTRAIRYYEELGLIVPRRSNGGFREYSDFEVEKLGMILKLKKLGLSLEEIQDLVKMRQCVGERKSASDLLTYLHKRLHEFEQKIDEYKDGIIEIKNMIDIVEDCGSCRSTAEIFKCEECLKKQDKEMPGLMKAIL